MATMRAAPLDPSNNGFTSRVPAQTLATESDDSSQLDLLRLYADPSPADGNAAISAVRLVSYDATTLTATDSQCK